MQRADEYLRSHPKDARVRFLKGVMLADGKRTNEAMGVFEKLSEDYPDLAEPYNNLAALYAASGDYARARTSLEQALRANPSYAIAQENLGDVYAALAAQAYTRTLKLDPGSVSVPSKLALVQQLVHAPGAGASAPNLGLQRAGASPVPGAPASSTGITP
jgi:tetratricopeptide (TPR) repeat protein